MKKIKKHEKTVEEKLQQYENWGLVLSIVFFVMFMGLAFAVVAIIPELKIAFEAMESL